MQNRQSWSWLCSEKLADEAKLKISEPPRFAEVTALEPSALEVKGLARVIGDPAKPEHVWMNACVAAGNRSLAPKPSLGRRLLPLMSGLGAIFASLTMLVTYPMAILLASNVAYHLFGTDINSFVHDMDGADVLGFVMASGAGFVFWAHFLSDLKFIHRLVSYPTTFIILALCAGGGIAFCGIYNGLALCLISLLMLLGAAGLGRLGREALPGNFTANHVGRETMFSLSLPALVAIAIMGSVLWNPDPPGPYTVEPLGSFICASALLSCVVLAPGIAIARASGCKSIAASALLGALVQMPLWLGLLISSLCSLATTIGALSFTNFPLDATGAAWKSFGMMKALLLFGTSAGMLGLTAAGGMLGTVLNRKK